VLAAALLCAALTVPARAGESSHTGDAENANDGGVQLSSFLPNMDLDFKVPRARGEFHLDGNLGDPMWRGAVRLDNFCEISPGENVEPGSRTESWFCYDDENLYIAFACYEDDPSQIRAAITDRDNIFSDDFAGVMIDTFRDQQTGYEFFVNPHGIQGDLRRIGNNEDSSYDTVWRSAARITDTGWTAEIALPFRSVRFPDDQEQAWNVHVFRVRPRDSREQISWAPISRDEDCFFCSAGTMHGLSGINSGRNIEVLPYAIGSQSGSLSGESDDNFDWTEGRGDADTGVGVKYGLTPNLTLDFTYNPDFSQIESDAAQIDVNNTFALFYPEKRPFFLEGADIFSTKIDAVYTRAVNDPIAAAKITGKVGRTTVGFMTAKDDITPYTVPFEERSGITTGDESYSNIGRVKLDILNDSYVGALVSDRRLGHGGGSNTAYGIDSRIRVRDNYRLEGQVMGSHTREPNDSTVTEEFDQIDFGSDGQYTSFFDGEEYDGYAAEANFIRSARRWNFNLWYENYSPTFRSDNGFIRANNYQTLGLWSGYFFYFDESKWLERIEPQIDWGRKVNHDGWFKDTWYQPSVWVQFKKQISMWTGFVWSDERFAGERVNGIRRLAVNLDTNFSKLLSGGFSINGGRSLIRDRDDPRLGFQRQAEVWATLKPTSQLQLETSYLYYRMDELDSEETVFDTYIVRNRLSYQFTRNLFLRVVGEYVDSARYVQVDPLLSYKINPFTVFFIGSSHSFSELQDDPDTPEVEVRDPHYRQTDRVFFVKFQYLFRV
jgi:hypothetical protein